MVPQTFSTGTVARLAGVSLRQLQWWAEKQIVSAHIIGHSRRYTTNQVIEIMIVADLRRKGLSLQRLRRIVRKLNPDRFPADRALYLVTDGRGAHIEEDVTRAISLVCDAKDSGVFVVDIGEHLAHLHRFEPQPQGMAVSARPSA